MCRVTLQGQKEIILLNIYCEMMVYIDGLLMVTFYFYFFFFLFLYVFLLNWYLWETGIANGDIVNL